MPFYNKLGSIPPKRHTQFRKPNGNLYHEELVSTEGFNSVYSLIYHAHPPTLVKNIGEPIDCEPKAAIAKNMQNRSFMTYKTAAVDDYLESRKVLLFNKDVYISVAAPKKSMETYFFKNADADEVIFVHEGSGEMQSVYGKLRFKYGDYIVIPRGTIYKLRFDTEENRLMITESPTPIHAPKRYQNSVGQLMEQSPYCERDIITPMALETNDAEGDFEVIIKKQDMYWPYTYATHPFDAIGWDGFLYPYIFSIHNFEPITGRVHMPPPIHQTFEARNFVICSFVPRLYDYHPDSIPAPYNHSNVDSDEVLYYVDGEFMSRKHVERGMISLHPKGIPHGPHPGTVEKSIGQKETLELAVMIDPFYPLQITQDALETEDKGYWKSWVE